MADTIKRCNRPMSNHGHLCELESGHSGDHLVTIQTLCFGSSVGTYGDTTNTFADHLTILASKEEEIKAANSQVERLKGLLREFRDFPIEHLASCNMCDEDDIGCSCGLTNCRARISEELK